MKAVIVAAGYGTRFFPMTKTVPKEMLPLYDRCLIDFIIDELEEAGVSQLIMITSRRKKVMDDYLDREIELETILEKAGKTTQLDSIRPRKMEIVFLRQQEMKGTGHALLLTKQLIGDQPFLVAYPDDIVLSKPGLSKSMVELYKKTGKSVLAVREEPGDVSRYGVVFPVETKAGTGVQAIVEKPAPGTEPSKMVSVGRYLFTPELLELLEEQYKHHKQGEFFHIDAINQLASQGKVMAQKVNGLMLDTGEPSTYFQSLLQYAFQHKDARKILDKFVKEYYQP